MPGPSNIVTSTIAAATQHLADGRCVAIPTETVYGLAARVDSQVGIASIFQLKQRPSFDPLIVHISELSQISNLADEWPALAASLAERFWPGPLTLVVKKNREVNPMISAGLDTVGIRMPKHPLALELIRSVGQPLAAPSANRFGRTSPTTAEHVRAEFSAEVACGEILVLDGGACDVGVESTVCLVRENEAVILRPGGVTLEEIARHIETSSALQDARVTSQLGHHASPGHTEHHYETRKPLIVSWSEPHGARAEYVIEGRKFRSERVRAISLSNDPRLAARTLYSYLREADEDDTSDALFIHRDLSRKESNTGLWQAVDDRLKRASRLQLGTKPAADD